MGEEAAVADDSEVAAGSGDVVREMTIADYEAARAFWREVGWAVRDDLVLMSKPTRR
jgi:hypothetical protein